MTECHTILFYYEFEKSQELDSNQKKRYNEKAIIGNAFKEFASYTQKGENHCR